MDDRPESRYSPTQIQEVLTFIAQQMNKVHTCDLAWWEIPRWDCARPRLLASMLAGGLLGMILGGLAFVPSAELGYAFEDKYTLETGRGGLLLQWLVFGFGVGLALGFGHGGREPRRVRKCRDITWWPVLIAGLAYGLASALVSVLARLVFSLVKDLTASPGVGQLVGQLVSGLVVGLLLGFKLKRDSLQAPVESRRKNRVFVVVTTIVAMIVTMITATIMVRFGLGLGFGFWFVFMAGSAAGIAVSLVLVLVVWFRFTLTPRLASRLVAGFADRQGRPPGPLESWRADRVFGVVTGLALGLALGPVSGLLFGLVFGFREGFVFVNFTLGGLVAGLAYGITSSVTWSTTLAWLRLRRSGKVPAVGLMPVLEDARKQGFLRTSGAVYQFQFQTKP